MKKLIKVSIFIAILVFCAFLTNLGALAAKPIEVMISADQGPGGVEEVVLNRIKGYLEDMSEGRFEVAVMLGGQLGSEEQVSEMLVQGEIPFLYTGTEIIGSYLGAGSWPLDIPFLFDSRSEAQNILKDMLPEFTEKLKPHGLQIADAVMRMPRKLTGKKAITTPDQVKGLKLRVPPIEEWLTVWGEILGAEAVALPGSEIFSGLQTGIADSQENPTTIALSLHIYEVNPYIMRTNHILAPRVMYMSNKWFNALEEVDQHLVLNAVRRGMAEQYYLEEEYEVIAESKLKELGVNFVEIDTDLWQKKVVAEIEETMKDKYAIEIWNEYIAPE